jgi:hypothetical protein
LEIAPRVTLFPPIAEEERTKLLLEAQSYWAEIDRRDAARVSNRDFWLEIIVIGLILFEVCVDVWGLRKEGIEFGRQQTVLTNLEKSSEATANAMVALQKTMETMNGGIRSQLSLNYELSVGLVMNRGDWALGVTNRGRTNITLWGQKVATEPRHMLSAPLTITPGETQDVDFFPFFDKMTAGVAPPLARVKTIPITVLLRSENGREYTAECAFEASRLLSGTITVQCQTTTVRAFNWSPESQ